VRKFCAEDRPGFPRSRSREKRYIPSLTERERDVLGAMAEGHSNDAIARLLFVSPKTVEANIHRLLQKLDISESPTSQRANSPTG
jgi:DNA-binding NarL/FixJ family response regulator